MSAYFQFISGAVMMSCFVAAAFFFRFAEKTEDSLFPKFGWAFVLFGIERIILMIEHARIPYYHSAIYLVRLLGFILILVAVIQKNRMANAVNS